MKRKRGRALRNRSSRRSAELPEIGAIRRSWSGRLRIALCYPNTYELAMGNLGFHQVYHLANRHKDVVCERIVVSDPPPRSLESRRPLKDFDIIAFSLSYESDLVNLVRLLHAGGLPLSAEERERCRSPLIAAGGVLAFLNPEPLAPFCDVIAVGEAEVILDPFLAAYRGWRRGERKELLKALSGVPGIYIPSFYAVRYGEGGELREREALDPAAPARVRRAVAALGEEPACTRVFSSAAEFGGMFLLELMRGCVHGCRFCPAAFIYRPPRFLPAGAAERALAEGLVHRETAGLVAASVTDHPEFPRLRAYLRGRGKRPSVASLRLDQLSEELLRELREAGHRTLTLAPEAGTERLRRIINKPLSDSAILSAMELIGTLGFPSLKLYFQVGLPFETEDDLQALPPLFLAIKKALTRGAGKRSRSTRITVSVNPFVPKPVTPFQWHPGEKEENLRRKLGRLRAAAEKLGILFSGTSPREAMFQAAIARGDRRTGEFLRQSMEEGKQPSFPAKGGPGFPGRDWYVHRPRDFAELLPWDFIDHLMGREILWEEYEHARAGKITPPCRPGKCSRCAACGE